jgi:NAD(P)-dependent dehydrogenase (short-subunit alcohol dehydrogenase family)
LSQVQAAGHTASCRCGIVPADVSDPEQAAAAVRQVSAVAGPPEIIVNSAGVVTSGYVEALDLAAFRRQIEVNYLGAVQIIQAALPAILANASMASASIANASIASASRQRRGGHIVNICSVAGFLGCSAMRPTPARNMPCAATPACCGSS